MDEKYPSGTIIGEMSDKKNSSYANYSVDTYYSGSEQYSYKYSYSVNYYNSVYYSYYKATYGTNSVPKSYSYYSYEIPDEFISQSYSYTNSYSEPLYSTYSVLPLLVPS